LPIRPSQALEFLCESGAVGLCLRVGFSSNHQYANPSYRIRLLRPRAERPRRGAAEQRDELAPFHLVTSTGRRVGVGAMRASGACHSHAADSCS
jgi:hypothetical protein